MLTLAIFKSVKSSIVVQCNCKFLGNFSLPTKGIAPARPKPCMAM